MSEHAVAYFGSKCAVVGNVGQPCTLTDSIVIVMVDPGFRIEFIAIIIISNTTIA